MPNRWIEREQAIMNGIMSLLVNECDALACVKKAMAAVAAAATDQERAAAREGLEEATAAFYEAVACKVRPTLQVDAEEAQQLRDDRDAFSKQAEEGRRALEYIASNAKASSPAHIEAFALKALGRN